MRIIFDTREDSYEDALGVLRRAYGRHVVVRKQEKSSAPSVQVEPTRRGAASKSNSQSATGRSGKQAGDRTRSANGSRRSVSQRASASGVGVKESRSSKVSYREAGQEDGSPQRAIRPGPAGSIAEKVCSQHRAAWPVGGDSVVGSGTRHAGERQRSDAGQSIHRLPGRAQGVRARQCSFSQGCDGRRGVTSTDHFVVSPACSRRSDAGFTRSGKALASALGKLRPGGAVGGDCLNRPSFNEGGVMRKVELPLDLTGRLVSAEGRHHLVLRAGVYRR